MLSGPYGFEEDSLAPLIGLRGPEVSINVSRAEVAIMHAMVDAIGSDGSDYGARRVLRELDIRHGAAASMMPDRDTIEITVPMSSEDVDSLRHVHRDLTRYTRPCRVDGADALIRELDIRIGAAQAADVALHATGAFENLGPVAGARPGPATVVYVDDAGAPPAATRPTPPRLRTAQFIAGLVSGFAGGTLGVLLWVLVIASWRAHPVLGVWIAITAAMFAGAYGVGEWLTGHARRLAAPAPPAPRSPINDQGLPVEMWDETEFTR